MRKSIACSKGALLLTTAFCSVAATCSVYAQDAAGVQSSDELIVYGTVVTRNRTDTVAPKLSYDLEYFQRFEPISAGDALKRVPGVSFSSDVLEYDQVQLRGLPSTYAQVQVNGQNMTGAGNDRVFFVDRIPAELIDSVEVIRSPSADMSSEGIGGTVNANLKRAGQIQGGWVRGSGFGVEEDELRGAGSVGYGTTIGDTSYLFSVDVQQRRNPKVKTTDVYDITTGDILDSSMQEDTRDGTDYAFNGEVAAKIGEGMARLYGFYVFTDRLETEFTPGYNFDDAEPYVETQREEIEQQNMSIAGEYKLPIGKDEALFVVGYNRFVDDLNATANEGETLADVELDEVETVATTDEDWFGTMAYTANLNALLSVKVGVDGRIKTRDFSQVILDGDLDDTGIGGLFDIEEQRVDPFIKATWNLTSRLSVETGLRYEHTRREISGLAGGTDFDGESTADEFNPSAHLRYALTDATMLRFSVARTVRRPNFDMLTAAYQLDEPVDEKATLGNPNLDQETAWGIDAGFDQKLGDGGIFGFNFFNRQIKNKIDLVGTGETLPLTCDDGNETCSVLTWDNIGDARAYGIEVDLDMPLTAFGLPDTTIFANYTWLRSEVIDPVTQQERAFNDQPDFVYNIGFAHNIPIWNSTFGASYQKRGKSLAYEFDEITELSYQGNLEAFWETRLSKSTVLRFTGTNLLDAEKLEDVAKYDGDLNDDQIEREIEREKSGRLFLMTVRQAF
jgi:outer membrane receptor protein involved in Fe transport